jgi:hypothetical protein
MEMNILNMTDGNQSPPLQGNRDKRIVDLKEENSALRESCGSWK